MLEVYTSILNECSRKPCCPVRRPGGKARTARHARILKGLREDLQEDRQETMVEHTPTRQFADVPFKAINSGKAAVHKNIEQT